MAYTVDQVVEMDVATSDAIKSLAEKHAAEMQPFLDRQKATRSWLLDHLNKTGADNVKTPHGTFYKSTVMSTSINKEHGDGWPLLLNFVLSAALLRAAEVLESHGGDDAEAMQEAVAAACGTPELDLVNRSVNKTAVKDLIDKIEGFDPATIGVKVGSVVNLNVRRA